jgi:hypothetical protein
VISLGRRHNPGGRHSSAGVIVEAVETDIELDVEHQALLARNRAMAGVERAVRELAASILSVVRGTGKPDLIGAQAEALVSTFEAHRTVAGYPPSAGEIASVLNIATKEERVALLNTGRRVERHAMQSMISGALLIATKRLDEIRSHTPGGIEGLTEDDYADKAAE